MPGNETTIFPMIYGLYITTIFLSDVAVWRELHFPIKYVLYQSYI